MCAFSSVTFTCVLYVLMLGQLTGIACNQCIHHDAATIVYSYSCSPI